MTRRLEALETNVALLKHTAVHTADILVDHTRRLDQLQRLLSSVEHRLDGVEQGLDRLEERRASAERFQRLEDRLDKVLS